MERSGGTDRRHMRPRRSHLIDMGNSFSYWEQQTWLQGYDAVVIGSGIVGIHAAWELKRKAKSMRVLLLERGSLPQGASTRNAGVACFGTLSEILDDLAQHPASEVFGMIEKRWKGLQRLRQNLGDKAMSFQSKGGHELFFPEQRAHHALCLERMDGINRTLAPILGNKQTYKSADGRIKNFGFQGTEHLILNVLEGQLDSGRMMMALLEKARAAGVEVRFGTEVKGLEDSGEDVQIHCSDGGSIRSKRVLLATNGFTGALVPGIDAKPARAQVLITSEIEKLPFQGSFHFDDGFFYFRNVGKRVLFGGGRNLDFKAEETTAFGLTEKVQQRLEHYLKSVILPGREFQIEQRWSGIMCMGSKRTPIIESLSKTIFCAVRLSGMGVAVGSQVGEEAADLLLASQ